MTTSTLFKTLALGVLLISQQAFGDVWYTQQLELSSHGVDKILIESGAGDLSISGSPSEKRILVFASLNGRELGSDDYTLSLTRVGSNAVLIAEIKSSWTANNYIDLKVTLPQSLALDIEDRSGDIFVENMLSDIRVDDRSGDLKINDIAGSVHVDDSSGDVTIRRVDGSLTLEDKSGDITIHHVIGSVDVQDNSGDIFIESTKGNVSLDDSSGDIEVIDTQGVVSVTDTGGDVDVNGAQDFNITKRGGGDVTSKNILSKR